MRGTECAPLTISSPTSLVRCAACRNPVILGRAKRKDRGRARELTDEQRQVLRDIRKEHPSASVPLTLSALVGPMRGSKRVP
jgi:hypothetical protein